MPDLPQEIIADILSRLSVKTLLRFRCVSKQWRSLIDSNDFTKSHLCQSAKTNSHRFFLVEETLSDIFAVDLDSLRRLDFVKPPSSGLCLLNSCNGLVLVVSEEVILWNPSTRKYKVLPPTPVERSLGITVRINPLYGFGYDSKSDDYKVVRVTEIWDMESGEYLGSEAKVYSLRLNSWKRVEDFPHILPCGKRVWGVYVNDALHTVVRHCHHLESIMAFDLGTAKHREVPLPDLMGENIGVAGVDAVGGFLTALVPRRKNRSEIWVMKEYGVKESWTKLFTFKPRIAEPYMNLTPLAYSKKGDEVFLNYDGRCLLAYNLKEKSSRVVNAPGILPQFYGISWIGSKFFAQVCVGSLVALDRPAGTKENVQEKKGKKKRDDFLCAGFKLVL